MLTVSKRLTLRDPYLAALGGGEVVDIRRVIAMPDDYSEQIVYACGLTLEAVERAEAARNTCPQNPDDNRQPMCCAAAACRQALRGWC
jgi:hypothetical protein